MSRAPLTLRPLTGTFAVCRLKPGAPVPGWASKGAFFSVTGTPDELSVVCLERLVPETVTKESGWSCLEVEGPLDFSLTGVLASLTAPLAEAGLSLFAISTFATDYLLIKAEDLEDAKTALARAGHVIGDGRPAARRPEVRNTLVEQSGVAPGCMGRCRLRGNGR